MRTIEITLGGKTHTIRELPTQKNAAWRARLRQPFGELANLLQHAMGVDLKDGPGLAGVVTTVSDLIMTSPDLLVDLVFAYSPELAAQRATIEADLYDSEVGEAFLAVLGLAFPFGALGRQAVAMLGTIGSPSASKPT